MFNPMALSFLMQEAEKGNPAAKQALTTAGKDEYNQSIEPPPTSAQVNVTAQVDPVPLPAQPPAQLPPQPTPMPDAKPVQGMSGEQPFLGGGGAPTQGLTGMSPGQPTGGDSGPANWKKDVGLALGGLLGAGAAKLFGGEGAAGQFMTGYAEPVIGNIQARQAMEMKRAQTVWADQWEQAKNIPPEMLDPKNTEYAELQQAHAAMQKDMETGNVNNPKSAAAFMMAHAKFRKEIDDSIQKVAIGREIEKSNLLADAQHQNNLKRIQSAMEVLNAPPGTVPEEQKQAAAAFLRDARAPQPREVVDPLTGQTVTKFLTDEEHNAWNFKVSEAKRQEEEIKLRQSQQAETTRHNRAYEGLQGREIGVREKEVEQRNNTLNSRRTSVAALGQLESAVSNTLAAMEQDPAMQSVPASQRKAIAMQKVMSDSVTQRDLLRASGAQLGKDAQGRPAIQINGQTFPFDPRNPKANLRVMEAVFGQLQSSARLGE